MRLVLFNKLIILRSPIEIYNLPSTITWGLTNKVKGGYLLFLDYDKVEYEVVREDVRYLQRKFKVGHALTRVSKLYNYKREEIGSYHVFFFKVFDSFLVVKKLVEETRCDEKFKQGWKYQHRSLVLRVGEKVDMKTFEVKRPATVFRELILQEDLEYKENDRFCRALVEFFEVLDGIELKKYFKNLDDTKELEFIRYVTGKVS